MDKPCLLFTAPLFAGTLLTWLAPNISLAEGGNGISPPARITTSIEQEINKRMSHTQEASALILDGDRLMADKDYAAAVAKYRQAINLLPKAPMTATHRAAALRKLGDASVAHATALAEKGNFDDANATLDVVLAPDMMPEHDGVATLKQQLKDSDRFNPAMSTSHYDNVIKVRNLMKIAEGHLALGDFNAANAAYDQVLEIDPHNIAARRGHEKCEKLISDYQLAAKDHTRQRMLTDVDRLWETAVPEINFEPKLAAANMGSELPQYTSKLRGIIFPRVSFDQATLSEVLQFINSKAVEVDLAEPNPTKRGVNLVLRIPPADQGRLGKISLELTEVPLVMLLDYVADQSGAKWKMQDGVITFTTTAVAGGRMTTRSYSVPPGFLANAPAAEAAAPADPFSAPAATGIGTGLSGVARVTARSFLEQSGVTFPEGSNANFDRSSSRLIVTNTDQNLDLVQTLVDQLGAKQTKQAHIKVTVMQIAENNLREIGFTALLGQFNIGSRLFGSGGTNGNAGSSAIPALDHTFFNPTSGATPDITGSNPLTAGLRSSGSLRTLPTIDDLLRANRFAAPQSNISPGILSLAGQFTDPQFQLIVRALNQKKGTDLLSSIDVVAKSGQIAKAKSVRELIYPTDFDPPQIPQNIAGVDASGQYNPNVAFTSPTGSVPTTPTTPTTFTTRDVGILLEAEPTISEDGSTVDIRLAPEFTEFLGFINYGTPIRNGLGSVMTENVIVQPVFEKIGTGKDASVNVTVYDGNTIAFGGLTQSKESKIEDKVPLLGDIPLIGRLFKSSVTESSRRAVLFFVTVNVQDPAGRNFDPARGKADETVSASR